MKFFHPGTLMHLLYYYSFFVCVILRDWYQNINAEFLVLLHTVIEVKLVP